MDFKRDIMFDKSFYIFSETNKVLVWIYAAITPVAFVLIFLWYFQKEYDYVTIIYSQNEFHLFF